MRRYLMCVTVLVAVAGLLFTWSTVMAELKATNVVYAWDEAKLEFRNSLVEISLDGAWTPFWHQLDFDEKDWISVTLPLAYTEPVSQCQSPLSTTLAGIMYYGLYHEDNSPEGAEGFQSTQNWELVDCDRDNDDDFDGDDLAAPDPFSRTLWISPTSPSSYTSQCLYYTTTTTVPLSERGTYCQLLSQDDVISCTTGNCLTEIQTTFFINLDLNCDGVPDVPIPDAGLCFYAEAEKPSVYPEDTIWKGNIQARISTVGGDKTVNFNQQPTALELLSFTASGRKKSIILNWETANETENLGFHLYRSTSIDGRRTRINAELIPTLVPPGSPFGAVYEYTDTPLEKVTRHDFMAPQARTYYYWLEDVDIYGRTETHGPVQASLASSLGLKSLLWRVAPFLGDTTARQGG